jgi:hypothetical protein
MTMKAMHIAGVGWVYNINQMKIYNLKSFGMLRVRRVSHWKLIRFVDGWQRSRPSQLAGGDKFVAI